MDNYLKSEILITLNDNTKTTNTNLCSNQSIKEIRTIGLTLNDFQIYQSLPVQKKVQYLLENGVDNLDF